MRRRSIGLEMRDFASRRGQHLGRSLLVAPAIQQRTEDDRRESRDDQRNEPDAPRIHVFSVPHAHVGGERCGCGLENRPDRAMFLAFRRTSPRTSARMPVLGCIRGFVRRNDS
jgi:hypothetical protein